MANWWDEAYSDITKWTVNADQLNKDRGAYKDAFQANTAEKGLNYDLTSRLMRESTDQEKELMQGAADLDRRNTQDLMTAEHGFKIAGMQESNRLSKDYLAAEGYQQRETLAEQGYQEREKVKTTGEEERRTAVTQGEQQREGLRTQGDEQRRTTAFEREHAAGLATRMSRR